MTPPLVGRPIGSRPTGDDEYVPGHGAVVDSAFVRAQQTWLRPAIVTNFNLGM